MPTITRKKLYDIDEVNNTIRGATYRAVPARVAPIQLLPVIVYIEDVTKKAREHLQRLQHQTSDGDVKRQLEGISTKLAAWEFNLSIYGTAVRACMATGNESNVDCTLWSVVAPLFFGIYDGPLGTSKPGSPALREPFEIANQLDEMQHFENTEWVDAYRYLGEETNKTFVAIGEGASGTLRLLGEVTGNAAAGVVKGLSEGLGPALSIGGGLLLAWILLRGKKKD